MEENTLLSIDKGRGEFIRVEVSEFKGKKRLNIRIWYTNEAGEVLPTKKGVTLDAEQFEKFKSILPQVEAELKGS